MKQEKIFLKDYLPPAFEVESLKLAFNLHEDFCRVLATSKVKAQKAGAPLELEGQDFKLVSVKIDGTLLPPNRYQVDPLFLRISDVPESFELEIETELKPQDNTSLEGLYKSNGIFTTQCEAQGFRKITYFWDRPDVMTRYQVSIEADKKKYPVLLSNGDRLKVEDLGNGRHKAYWQDPHKKPCYLFALVAGDLGMIKDEFTTASGRKVNLEVYAAHGKQDRCHHAMTSLKKSMKWDEEAFGREYDLNDYMIVAIDDFNAGAMENKGLNIFNSRLVLADKKTASDQDFFNIESVVAHEYFHNWTGNRVTLRDWFQLSLKEGLTVFRDQEFSADMTERGLQRIDDVDGLRAGQFTEDAGPNAHPVRPESCMAVDNFFTMTIYEKGSELIRMMQTLVGRKGFRKGMDLYFERHDGQAVTTDDFAAAIADANNADFSQLKLWYSQAGTPEVEVIESYVADKQEYRLKLRQSCRPTPETAQKKPFHIPLLIALFDSSGNELSLHCEDLRKNTDGQNLIELKDSEQVFVFKNLSERPLLSINRQFSAPIRLKWPAKDDDLYTLMAKDTDSFNRREASRQMSQKILSQMIQAAQQGKDFEMPVAYLKAFESILVDTALDPALKAKIIGVPSYSSLALEQNTLDMKAFQWARETFIETLAKKFESHFLSLYQQHQQDDLKHRRLKSVVLSFLVAANKKHLDLAVQLFKSADNMTDTQIALAAISDSQHAQRQEVLTKFYEEWKTDSVVVNRWFVVQAQSEQKNCFEEVQKLTQHPSFNITNPNNVYSLLRVFAGNLVAFHNSATSTYDWYADRIVEIDKLNPQVAARLATAFNFTEKLPADRQALSRQAIQKILSHSELSKNTKELLVKI